MRSNQSFKCFGVVFFGLRSCENELIRLSDIELNLLDSRHEMSRNILLKLQNL